MASAHSTTFTVDGTNCTLPDAVKAASTNTAVGGCPAGSAADTLNLSAKAYTLTAAADGSNGLWPISGAVTINGKPGIGSVISRSTAVAEQFRLFQVNNDGVLTLSRVSVQNGKVDGKGGGILNSGKLTLIDTTVSGNSVGYDATYGYGSGGGIFSVGPLTLTNSTVSGNSAARYGGGIQSRGRDSLTLTNSVVSGNSAGYHGGGIRSYGPVTLTNSTVSGNSANAGAGIYSGGNTTLTLASSTVSGNSAASYGGGISSYGTVTLTNSTVSGNSAASFGGGIYGTFFGLSSFFTLTSSTVSGNSAGIGGGIAAHYRSTLTLINSLTANSPSGGDCAVVFGSGTPIHKGKNLIEDGSCAVVANGGLQGDPRLGPLLDNGGPTRTHALLARSLAINAADDTVLPKQLKDQRGAKRPQGTHRDIGAFELISSAEATLQPIIIFFDQKTASGELLGIGASSAAQLRRLAAMRGQLLLTSDFIRQANTAKACEQLKNTLPHIDTDLTPDASDYVTGTAGGDLAVMVKTVRTDLSCP